MNRKERKAILKESVRVILISAENALNYYNSIMKYDSVTMKEYDELYSHIRQINDTSYYKSGRQNLYHSSSRKLTLDATETDFKKPIKTDFPRQYKRILKEFKQMGFNYFEVKDYLNSDNIFNKLSESQSLREKTTGWLNKDVEKTIEEVEQREGVRISYRVNEIIIKRHKELELAERKINKKDLEHYEAPAHIYTLEEVAEIANKLAKEEIKVKLAEQEKKEKQQNEGLER